MMRRGAFTLIELLVVIAIIALLISILLPSLAVARRAAWGAVELNNQRQLTVASGVYNAANDDWFNPIQDNHPDPVAPFRSIEGSWRIYLYEAAGQRADVFDSPGERVDVYADGLSELDMIFANLPNSARDKTLFGRLSFYEIYNASGIAANLVHYWAGTEGRGPFGRPKLSAFGRAAGTSDGYPEGLARLSESEDPSHLILFGSGGSSSTTLWPEDRWWIYKIATPVRIAGFSRFSQSQTYGTDSGATRHDGKGAYTFADGSGRMLDPREIPCDYGRCWWSLKMVPHQLRTFP